MRRASCVGVLVVCGACSSAAAPLPIGAAPGVIYTFPRDAQLDVPVGARVVVAFSEPVVAGAIAACTGTAADVVGAICLVGPDGPVAATAEVVGDGSTVQFAGGALAAGATYAVYARAALAPTAKNLPASGPLFRFTTRSVQPRAAAPVVIAVNGAAPDAPAVSRPMFESSTIRLVFSEPLDPRAAVLAPGAIELVEVIDEMTSTAIPASLLVKGIHVAIDPLADLKAGALYQLKIGSLVTDLGGQPVTPVSIALTPEHTGADAPISQMLRTRQPGDRGSAVSHTGADRNAIVIDQPLIGTQTVQVQPSTLAAELGDPALGGPLTFTIRRGQRLRAGGLDVKLGGELPLGVATGDILIDLISDGSGRIYRNPYQPDQRPDNDRSPLLVELTLDLSVSAVDPAGNAVLTQTVLGVQGAGVVIATDSVLDIETVVSLELDLLGIARAPTNLVLELITDLAAASDADHAPPALLASMPNTAAEPLPVDAGIELIFTEPIDLDRARAGGIRLEALDGVEISTVIESHGAAVVLRPRGRLAYATTYRVVLADVTDMAGNRLAAVDALSFSTPPLLVTTAPATAASVFPGVPCALSGGDSSTPGRCVAGAGSDDPYRPFSLAANQPLLVTFTQPLVPASVALGTACNTGSVRIEEFDASGVCVAPATGTFRRQDRAFSFVPDAPWQLDKHYRLTMASGPDTDATCAAGELCGFGAIAASFDPLFGDPGDPDNPTDRSAAGGPDLVIDFAGAAATDATLVLTRTAPFADVNGSGFVEEGEPTTDDNRAALRIIGTTGVVKNARFDSPGCVADAPASEACLHLSGAMPVQLLPLAHDCVLPGGATAARCVPVVLSPQLMYATSVTLVADARINGVDFHINGPVRMLVMRIREPASGPVVGYLVEERGSRTATLVVSLDVYLDAPDLRLPLTHDLHSKPLSIALRGPLRFLPDGRIAISVANVAAVPLSVNLSGSGAMGSVEMVVPAGEMKLQLVSPPLRGGL